MNAAASDYSRQTPDQKARAVQAAASKQKRLRLAGLCSICGKPRDAKSSLYCLVHARAHDRHVENYRRRRAEKDPSYPDRYKARCELLSKQRDAQAALARELERAAKILRSNPLRLDAEATNEIVSVVRLFVMGYCRRGHERPRGTNCRMCEGASKTKKRAARA